MKTKFATLTLLAAAALVGSVGSLRAANANITSAVAAESTVQFPTNGSATSFTNFVSGYNKVKTYALSPGLSTRAYFRYDLTGLNANTNFDLIVRWPATNSNNGTEHFNIWALNQAYPGLTNNTAAPSVPALSWWNAQANNTNATSDDLLTNGTFTATLLGDLVGGSGSKVTNSFTLRPPWGQYVFNNNLVIVLTPTNDVSIAQSANAARLPTNSSSVSFQPLTAGTAPPTISVIAAQTVQSGNASAVINFTVNDPLDGPNALVPVLTLGNTNNAQLTTTNFGGAGASRTLQFTPISIKGPGQTANVTVTLTVTDASGNSATTAFLLTVTPQFTLPVIHTGTNTVDAFSPTNTLLSAGALTIPFTVTCTNIAPSSLLLTVATNAFTTNIASISFTKTPFGSGPVGSVGNSTNICTLVITPSGAGVGIVNVQAIDPINLLTDSVNVAVMVLPSGGYAVYDNMNYAPSVNTWSSSVAKTNLADASVQLWNNRSVSGSVEIANSSSASGGGSVVFVPNGAPMIRGSSSGNSDQLRLAGAPYHANSHNVLYACIYAQWCDLASNYGGSAGNIVTNSIGGFVEFAADAASTSVVMGQVCTVTNGVGGFNLGLYQSATIPPVLNPATTLTVPLFDGATLNSQIYPATPSANVPVEISYDTDTGISKLWVNGTGSADTSAVFLQDVAVTNLADVSYLVLRQNGGMGNILISHAAVKVVTKPIPVIAGITNTAPSAYKIAFTTAPGSGSLSLLGSSTVNGTYTSVGGAVIAESPANSGNFTATFTGSGSQNFYRISQNASTNSVAFPF